MQIVAISQFKNISFSKNTFQLNYDKKKGKDSSFLSKKISFLGKMQTVSDFLYEMSWLKHSRDISQIEPSIVEKYFNSFGVCANFSGGNKYARQFISFCCFHVSEMFRQIQSIIPTKISIIDFSKLYKDSQLSDAIGVCYHSPDFKNNFPIRTVLFNSFETNKPNYWEHQFENQIKYHEENALSTKHFLSPFLHEFAHNVHFHKLYSKFGCPYANQGYIYNPKTQDLMTYLNLEIKDEFGNDVSNPCISYAARKALNTSSRYGSSRLPETFAEEFARTIVESMNLTTLRLTKNPFPMAKHNPTLQQVLYETWEGLIADGNGLI